MLRNLTNNRTNFLKYAVQRLMTLIDDPETGNGYIQRRRKQLGIEESFTPPIQAKDPALELLSHPSDLSLDGADIVKVEDNTDPHNGLSENQRRYLAAAAKIKALGDQVTLSEKQKKVLVRAAQIEQSIAAKSPPTPSMPDTTASTTTASPPSPWSPFTMFKSAKTALTLSATSFWTGVDVAGLINGKLDAIEKFKAEINRIVNQELTNDSMPTILAALLELVSHTQGHLPALRISFKSEHGRQLEAIMRIFKAAFLWFQKPEVQSLKGMLIANDTELEKLSAVASTTYDGIQMQFVADIFKVAFIIEMDAICATEAAILGGERLVPDTVGELLMKQSMFCIRSMAEFHDYTADAAKRAGQLAVLVDAVAKTVSDQQELLESKRMLPNAAANLLSTFLPSYIVATHNQFLDDLVELLAEHKAKVATIPQLKASVAGTRLIAA